MFIARKRLPSGDPLGREPRSPLILAVCIALVIVVASMAGAA